MKKNLLGAVLFTAISFAAGAQQRTVLYEEFTGENCGPCAGANPGLEALMAANPTKIIHVTFMEPVPTTGYFTQSVAINDQRFSYYNNYWISLGFEFTPSGMMDGFMPDSSGSGPSFSCGNVADFDQTDIDNEYAKASPFTITATHYYNTAHDSVFGKVVVKAVSAIGGSNLKLRATFVKTMNFTTPPGDNGETHFENVARAMFPSEAGQSIAASWAVGTTNTYTYKGKIAHLDTFTNTTTVDSGFVVWIQRDSAGYSVQQAARSNYVPLGVTELANAATSLNIYPNPANDQATLSFDLLHAADVSVKIIDQTGRTIQMLPSEKYNAGTQKINIATNNLSAGVYSVIAEIDGYTTVQKLSVIK